MSAYQKAKDARAIFLDWDGCLVEEGKLKPGALAFLDAFGERAHILSNNSTQRPSLLAGFLRRAGVRIAEARIHLAGQTAMEFALAQYGSRPVFMLATTAMRRVARNIGLNLRDDDEAAAVLLLRDTQFTYDKLDWAVNLLRHGAELVVANPDLSHPRGKDVAPETGALLAAIAACLDLASTRTTIIGKPAPYLYERALARAGVRPGEALMIGDNPDTDIQGALNLGLDAILLNDDEGVSLATLMAQQPRSVRRAV